MLQQRHIGDPEAHDADVQEGLCQDKVNSARMKSICQDYELAQGGPLTRLTLLLGGQRAAVASLLMGFDIAVSEVEQGGCAMFGEQYFSSASLASLQATKLSIAKPSGSIFADLTKSRDCRDWQTV
jgi:hypothetical protein